MYSAFFYGTLCVPEILKRVLGNDGSHLTREDAVLLDHVRLKVKGEGTSSTLLQSPLRCFELIITSGRSDYPALLDLDQAEKIIPMHVSGDLQARVQGVVVHGLTEEELDLLDEFEGDVGLSKLSLCVHAHQTLIATLTKQPWVTGIRTRLVYTGQPYRCDEEVLRHDRLSLECFPPRRKDGYVVTRVLHPRTRLSMDWPGRRGTIL